MRLLFSVILLSILASCYGQNKPIDREELVRRHSVKVSKADPLSSLTVGNGHFAFTIDVTGMQSFPEFYAKGVPLGTQSEWGWHSFPNVNNYRFEETLKVYETDGRKIPYPVQVKEPERNKEAVEYFRINPHRLQLGNIGLHIKKQNAELAGIDDIKNINQQLDLWTGIVTSSFTVENVPVKVWTVCDPYADRIAFKIESSLLKEQRISVLIRFPYPNGKFKDEGINFESKEAHSSKASNVSNTAHIERVLDSMRYHVKLAWSAASMFKETDRHCFLVTPRSGNQSYEFTCEFSKQLKRNIPESFNLISQRSATEWKLFWLSGGAVDFSGSTDPRAFELERRIILSQYLMRTQEASGFPPQETGLTYNSWYGRPHLEMHWWHSVQYALWGRPALLQQSLDWYFSVADKAREIAKRQGFDGLRWQKMTDPYGGEAPSSVGSFLIWQQPHFIYMAELLYRDKKDKRVLNKYKDLLFATADFMASFPTYDSVTGKYNLGRGLIPAQERFDAMATFNPAYELAYWHWALNIAQEWRLRLGMKRNSQWDTIIRHLAPLPKKDGLYLATENATDCYDTGSRYLTDHPAVLGAYASIPAANGLDPAVMKNTFDTVWKKWQWNDTWGWDFPLTAMAATRLNLPDKAIDALFMPVQTNTWLINGHNYQDERLTIYMPGNGGLLSAIAMMCAGFDGCKVDLPGIPKDGKWRVRWEGLKRIF